MARRSKYINPLTDFGLKRIFGKVAKKDLLIDFLNSVLEIDGEIVGLYVPEIKRIENNLKPNIITP